MTLDDKLLEQAAAAAASLVEAERRAQLTRAEYHTVVRRLHLAGGSLREIAAALGVSHQRVQQIVGQSGGSWWQRIWRTRTVTRDAVCTFCGRPPSEVAKLIAGPNVYVCDSCVTNAERIVGGRKGTGGLAAAGERSRAACAFCGKRRTEQRPLVVGPANVCGDCLALCRQILDDRGRP